MAAALSAACLDAVCTYACLVTIPCLFLSSSSLSGQFDGLSSEPVAVLEIGVALVGLVRLALALGLQTSSEPQRRNRSRGELVEVQDVSGFVKSVAFHFVIGVIVSHTTLVLFGAPIFDLYYRTFLLSCVLSLLIFVNVSFSSCGSLGKLRQRRAINASSWAGSLWEGVLELLIDGNGAQTPRDVVLLWQARGALAGAWAGALPIPLDWDRPWQQWPVTIVYACLAGFALGGILSALIEIIRGDAAGKKLR